MAPSSPRPRPAASPGTRQPGLAGGSAAAPPGALRVSRRHFCRQSAWLAAGAAAGLRAATPPAPANRVHSLTIISREPQYYHGWPTLARCREGQLLLVYSGGRQAHVCPFGRVELMRSHDQGRTWTWPEVLLDSPIDDRDAGVLQTVKGTLLVTSFTSLAYTSVLAQAAARQPGEPGAWPAERLAAWRAARERLTPAQQTAALGQWMIRSTDGGVTWSGRYPSVVNSPHGPIQLADGRLLYAGKELWTGQHRTGVCVSKDDGRRWKWLAGIPVRPGDQAAQYHELHAVETAERRLLVHIRNENPANSGETLQSESRDGGHTWSVPHPIGVWGLPSHLLRLRSGRLLMTYGHRRPPLGNQARLSDDHGRSWSEPVILSGDGASGDLGYPSTVELPAGDLLTVWYEVRPGSPQAVLRQARWTLEG